MRASFIVVIVYLNKVFELLKLLDMGTSIIYFLKNAVSWWGRREGINQSPPYSVNYLPAHWLRVLLTTDKTRFIKTR